MQNKRLIVMSMLLLMLVGTVFASMAAAREDDDDADSDKAADGGLIAPAPDMNSTITDGEQQNYTLDGEGTLADDNTVVPDTQNGEPNLIATNTSANENTLPIIAIVAVAVAIVGGAISVVSYRRNAAKRVA